jgi:hypothetical protein
MYLEARAGYLQPAGYLFRESLVSGRTWQLFCLFRSQGTCIMIVAATPAKSEGLSVKNEAVRNPHPSIQGKLDCPLGSDLDLP